MRDEPFVYSNYSNNNVAKEPDGITLLQIIDLCEFTRANQLLTTYKESGKFCAKESDYWERTTNAVRKAR